MDKGGRGGGQPMWIIFKFYNIIIKFANVDKGGGDKTLIHKMWIKRRVFVFEPLPYITIEIMYLYIYINIDILIVCECRSALLQCCGRLQW